MKVEIEALDKVRKAVTVEVDAETFAKSLQEAYQEKKKKITIPGFRKGKAPRALIEQYYGKDFFYYDAAEKCIFPSYLTAVKENEDELKPIADPEFEVVQLELDKPFVFKATVDTKQNITLGEYKGIEIEKINTDVTDEMIMKELKQTQERTALLEDVEDADATVNDGDIVIIDFTGKKDGVEFPGGQAENYELEIGSNSFIPGFEENVKGMKAGDVKDISLTFPENYHSDDLAGEDVVFKVKLNDIKRKVYAELDDDFAKDVSEFDTLAEFKEDIKSTLQKDIDTASENQYKNKIIERIVKDSDVLAPESMIEKELETYMNEMNQSLNSQGIDLESYLKLTGGNIDDIKKELRKRAENTVKSSLVLDAVAEKEEIDVPEDELEAEHAKLASENNMKKEELIRILMMQGQGDAIRRGLVREKTMEFLFKNARIG